MSAKPLRTSDQIVKQLKRVNGQVAGLIKMYEDERACIDVVRQVLAARSSLGRVAQDLLTNEAVRCSRTHKPAELSQVLKEGFRY